MSEIPAVFQFLILLALLGVAAATIVMPFAVIGILRCLRRVEAKLKETAPYVPAIHKKATESTDHLRNLIR